MAVESSTPDSMPGMGGTAGREPVAIRMLRGLVLDGAHRDGVARDQRGVALDHLDVAALQQALDAARERRDDAVLALDHGGQVELDAGGNANAVSGGIPALGEQPATSAEASWWECSRH